MPRFAGKYSFFGALLTAQLTLTHGALADDTVGMHGTMSLSRDSMVQILRDGMARDGLGAEALADRLASGELYIAPIDGYETDADGLTKFGIYATDDQIGALGRAQIEADEYSTQNWRNIILNGSVRDDVLRIIPDGNSGTLLFVRDPTIQMDVGDPGKTPDVFGGGNGGGVGGGVLTRNPICEGVDDGQRDLLIVSCAVDPDQGGLCECI